jgi:hypothetical protein
VTAVRRRLAHPVARGLLRDAGPPNPWQAAALWVGGIGGAVIASLPGMGLVIPAAFALAIVTIPAIADTDGWRIRLGMAWLAAEQNRRGRGGMPRSVAGAERWLVEHGDEEPLRVSVLIAAGRLAEARALLESKRVKSSEDRAIVARMLASIDGIERGRVDPRLALDAIDELPPEQRRYHSLSLAWSTAWVEKANRRPWRREFAAASRGIGRQGIPTRWLIGLSIHQLVLPLCVAVVFGVWTLIIGSR